MHNNSLFDLVDPKSISDTRDQIKARAKKSKKEAALKPLDWRIKCFAYGNSFIVDVTEKDAEYEMYLSHKDYGRKMHIFSILKKDLEKKQHDLPDLIINNVDEYMEIYREEVMFDAYT